MILNLYLYQIFHYSLFERLYIYIPDIKRAESDSIGRKRNTIRRREMEVGFYIFERKFPCIKWPIDITAHQFTSRIHACLRR